jgi:hypothetical protein
MILETLALVLTTGGLGTAWAKWEANKEVKAAYADLKQSVWDYEFEKERWQETSADFIAERTCFYLWLMPRAREAAGRVGEPDVSSEALGGQTHAQVSDLMRRARAVLIGPKATVDLPQLMASGGALAIQGIEHLDHLPILQQTVGDVVSHLPIPGAGELAGGLGDLAGAAVTDVLSSALLVFSVIRIGFNIRGIAQAGERAEAIRRRTEEVADAASSMSSWSYKAATISKDADRASYELFKWTWVAEQLAREKNDIGGWRRRLARKLGSAFDAFSAVQAEAVVKLA